MRSESGEGPAAGAAPVLLLGALDAEVASFAEHIETAGETRWREYRFIEGRIRGQAAVVSRCGVGKSLSAMLTQHLIDRYAPSAVIFTGVAGALNPQLEIGDTVVARTCMQYDLDARALGFELGEVPYSRYRILESDRDLVQRALTCRPSAGSVYAGHVLTGDSFIVTSKDDSHRYLREELGGDAVEMEGASVGLVATVNGIPFVVIRTISDKADASASINFAKFVKKASRNAWEFIDHILP
ncbi:MAG: 5'-methylthioadenosine/adenosylhomocysteine nucleosidase [Spirochaetaceae bacterium]